MAAVAVAVAIFDGNDFTTRLSGLNTNTGEDVSAGAPETAAPPPTPGAPRGGEGAARRPPDASAAPLPENAVGSRDVHTLFLHRQKIRNYGGRSRDAYDVHKRHVL